MSRSFGLVDYKVQEAEYFLLELKRLSQSFHFGNVQFVAAAFVSAVRSVTFAMQASLKGNAKFDAWYEGKQSILRANPLAKFFHDFRTVTQHLGVDVVSAAASTPGGMRYYFMSCADLPNVPHDDVVSSCQTYFRLILELVYDCYIHMGPVVNRQLYFTAEHFASRGLSIEDAEEEMCFPRGWTDIGKPETLPYRWELLRRQADGCLIDEQFQRWLGKVTARPECLPPYVVTP
jgi:hypothetical protein